MTRRFPWTPLAAGLAAGVCLALAACDSGGRDVEAPPVSAPALSAPADAPAAATALQTRATLAREPAEQGRSLRVLVENLRAGERVVLIALEGPDGARVVAGPRDIRTGSRASGSGSARPRVQIQGGNNDPMGVTLSLDVFSTRPEGTPERESGLAWAFLPLPDPAAYAADPGAWTVSASIEDEVGRSLSIVDR